MRGEGDRVYGWDGRIHGWDGRIHGWGELKGGIAKSIVRSRTHGTQAAASEQAAYPHCIFQTMQVQMQVQVHNRNHCTLAAPYRADEFMVGMRMQNLG
jgi:hypothetical protein